ncbi:AsmA-like C-terminal region-containing protein [Flavobacterium sp. DG1-102-2]|uniref:AsmA-like C-terminal region-containing protein n=1 Tax=Flavobacterium sp. DG1-102-2 TaxID=3081663 RepID=UPI00294A5EDA|nr:AsmA-like C-terminal region-containing protein [Flavobacterium sp. DG1-102-2]MDV6168997.1 AsmA-like C-terminal region-containing protein [Flavobacterium sp. DG1-102-2]
MVKKILKWTGIVLLVIIIALAAAPFLFKDKIKELVLKTINENVDATVSVEDVSLSLFRSFPKANVTIEKLSVINKAPFAGDTLVYMGEVDLDISVKELFKSDGEPMNIEYIGTKNGIVNILFNKDGIGNFDIAIKSKEEKPAEAKESKPFALNMQKYKVENLRFKYADARSGISMVIDSLNHEGKGNMAANKLDLDTKTTAKLSLSMGKANYMKNVALSLDAVLGLDLDKSIYTFKNNKALINQLPLEFDGTFAMVEQGQQIDITFKTPTSSFKNFLGLVPEAYSGNLASVKTEGDFTINGKVNGLNGDNSIPKFNVAIASNNASFKYPDLPKSVQNIVIDTKIINETGVLNDTYVNLDKLSFRIDQDTFDASATIKNIIENALVDAKIKGTVNLANVSKAYPVKLDMPLSGILKADVETKFDMKSVETSQYEKIQNNGTISLSGFTYAGEGLAKPIKINMASVQFNPSRITLSQFNAVTGGSDIAVTGTLDNFYGFVFRDQTLKGNFNMNSNRLLVADFMAPEAPKTTTTKTTEQGSEKTETKKTTTASDAVKIPAFLDCTITAKAGTVVYDNLQLSDVSGKMIIKDEAVTLQNVKTSIFGGQIGMNGTVSTKAKTPTFDMDLNLNNIDITQSFNQLEMLKAIAPIAGVVTGKINTAIKVNGNLDSKEMTPDLNSLSGDLAGSLAQTAINPENSKLLSALTSNVKFLDPKKIDLNKKINLTFDKGKVIIKPIDLKYQDIDIKIDGTHGFDQNMAYNVAFDVPAKYLGNDVNKLLTSIKSDPSKISVPVNAIISGNFKNPKVSTDLGKAVTNLTTQLVKQQKDKYVDEAKTKGADALNKLLGGNKTSTDTTKTAPKTNAETQKQLEEKGKEAAGKVLQGLFKKKEKKE